MINKELIISLMFDHFLCKLSDAIKRKDYVFKEFRKVSKKVKNLNAITFLNGWTITNDSWIAAQNKLDETEYSLVLLLCMMIEKHPFLIKYYKLNMKSFEKLKHGMELGKHSFRVLKILNTIESSIEVELSYYNNNKKKEKR